MKFSKYILACGCLCNAGFAAYAGEDAAITELRESIESLKSQVTALKAKDEAIEEQNQTFDKSLEDIKSQVTETSQKLDTISQKLENTQAAQPDNNEENEQIKSKLAELESNLNEVKTSIPSAEDLQEIKSSLSQATASITTLTQEIESQKTINEQQNLDLGKNEARIDKIERSNTTSAVANVAGGLLGTALQGGLNILSQKLNADSLKESLAKGESTEELTKNMTPEEKSELEAIKQEIVSGKSDQEIQSKLETLKSKVADREEKQLKFPETIFYGIDPFDSSTILHLLNLGRNGNKIDSNAILENLEIPSKRKMNTDYINTMLDYINLIYDWGQKGATLKDIINNIKIISGGSPKKIVKSELLKQTSENQFNYTQQPTQPSNFDNFAKENSGFSSNSYSSIVRNNQIEQNSIYSRQNVSMEQALENQVLNNELQSQEASQNIQNSMIHQGNNSQSNSISFSDQAMQSKMQETEKTLDQIPASIPYQRETNLGLGNPEQSFNSQLIDSNSLINQSHKNINQLQNNSNQNSMDYQVNNQRSDSQMGQNPVSENQRVTKQNTIQNSQTVSNNPLSMNQVASDNTQIRLNNILQNQQINQRINNQNSVIQTNASINSGTQIDQRNNLQNQTDSVRKTYEDSMNHAQEIQTPQKILNNQNTTISPSISVNRDNESSNRTSENQTSTNTKLKNPVSQNSMNNQTNVSYLEKQNPLNTTNTLNSEPDTFDMTVMDIDNNNYYDVTKKKFMRIAKPSSKFPTTVVTKSNVRVNPLDSFAAQRASNISR